VVLDRGVPELIAAVDAGRLAVSRAARFVHDAPETQERVAAGAGAPKARPRILTVEMVMRRLERDAELVGETAHLAEALREFAAHLEFYPESRPLRRTWLRARGRRRASRTGRTGTWIVPEQWSAPPPLPAESPPRVDSPWEPTLNEDPTWAALGAEVDA
jgi:hypothetical protein